MLRIASEMHFQEKFTVSNNDMKKEELLGNKKVW